MRRRSLRPKQIVSELQSKPKRRIANGRRRKHRPKRIASGQQRKRKRRIATVRPRKLRPKPQLTRDGRTADLRLRHEVHRVPRTKRPRLLELKPRPHNSRHRPTIHATKVNRATNGKRKTNGTDLAQGCRLLCERARRLRRALLLVAGTDNHRKSHKKINV